jgi:hypothetical protein
MLNDTKKNIFHRVLEVIINKRKDSTNKKISLISM